MQDISRADCSPDIEITLRGKEASQYTAIASDLHALSLQAQATAYKVHKAVARLTQLTQKTPKEN